MIVDTIFRVERWARLRRPTLPLMTVAGAMLALLASVLLLVQPAAASPLEPGTAVIGTAPQQSGSDYDADDDGLIEISDLAQLDAVRYDADGDGSGSDLAYQRAFPRALADMGCPAGGCQGYELAADLDFDTNGNGQHDEGDAYWNSGGGWMPMSLAEGTIFDGNGHTISNLSSSLTREDPPGGLFSRSFGTVRNIRMVSVNISGDMIGALVGDNRGEISRSYSDGNLSSRSFRSRVSHARGRQSYCRHSWGLSWE